MFANFKEWKLWQWIGMGAFGILLVFFYFTNKSAFSDMRNKMKDFQDSEDDVENQQKEDTVAEVRENAKNLAEAETKIQLDTTRYEAQIKEDLDETKSVETKVDDFNNFMGKP